MICGSVQLDASFTAMWDANLSEATINTSWFTVKYLPFPHPTSRPIDPGASLRRKSSTIGHGCHGQYTVAREVVI